MVSNNFKARRIIAWLIDNFLFYLTMILMLFLSDVAVDNMYEIGEQLGFQTTITEQGGVLNNFVDFWQNFGMYLFYYIPAILYLILSKVFSKKWLKGSSIGKWLTKLGVEENNDNLKFLLSFIFFCCLYYVIPYWLFDYYYNISSFNLMIFIGIYLLDIAFVFIKGQLFHNYLFGIKVVSDV